MTILDNDTSRFPISCEHVSRCGDAAKESERDARNEHQVTVVTCAVAPVVIEFQALEQ